MRFIHNSRLGSHRSPFGAVEAGTTVELKLVVEEPLREDYAVILRTWVDGEGERRHFMERTETVFRESPAPADLWACAIECERPALVWYSFIIRWNDWDGEHELRVGAPEGRSGGEGVTYDRGDVPSFQITVYKHRETRPSWYEKGMVYQIFPDRYRRDEGWLERSRAVVETPRAGIPRRLVEDWNEPPVYERAEDKSIASWDFYGGSLKGITGDLDRLHELGVTAIYLNPIFEAASNHRYDTGDYLHIDPMLGTEEDFSELCREAERRGMAIILDGVFNHTGDDSLYFNRYGNYPGVGAWQSEDSPWRGAYRFNDDGSYACWWGISNMPDFNQDSPLVRELLLGEQGVIRTWTRAGAHGWRLDVADELSEDLISEIKRVLLEEKPDALLLGEVWEDASNKVSYGKLRRYLLGDELDSAMNYPFRDMVIGFLMGHMSAYDAAEAIETLRENYPREALACCLNLLGSHDRPRIASLLGGGPDESQLPEEERGRWRLTPEAMNLAKSRFWLATLMQMTFPGVPSLYYGDEFGLEGLSDPGNRRTLPALEDIRDTDMLTIVKNASAVRRALPVMVEGDIEARGLTEDVLLYTRSGADGAATVLINRSSHTEATVRVPALGEAATDVVSGREYEVLPDGTVEVHLWPFGSAVVYFHDREQLQLPIEPGAGVVCHITSVPTDTGTPGTLGARSKRFIDHLAAMGMRYWQVLPVNPVDPFGSPYAGPSACAGNISLLPWSESELRADYLEWKRRGGAVSDAGYVRFAQAQAAWLEPWCAFAALKVEFGGASRHDWPEKYRSWRRELLLDPLIAEEAQVQAYLQYRFDREWRDTCAYAHSRGVNIIGDIPMYVSDDSSDVWSSPELFTLDRDGRPTEIAGAPPDALAPEGQVWGNPTFRWDRMRDEGYRWWLMRLERACSLYDYVRLDHFLGFHNYFSIPAGQPGSAGRWLAGPGRELFEAARERLGALPFIAEDLGVLTPGVRALLASCGFAGMDVLEFSDYDVRGGLHPAPGKIFYTSTHDTSTLAGFCRRSFTQSDEEAAVMAANLVKQALESDAGVVMMPLQDVLGLGDEARMNTPGTAEGNWSWQATEADIAAAEERTGELVRASGRA